MNTNLYNCIHNAFISRCFVCCDWSYDNIRDTTTGGSCCAFDVWVGRDIVVEDDVGVVAGGHCQFDIFGRHTGNWFDWPYNNIRDITAGGSCYAFDVWVGRGIIVEDDVGVVAGGHCQFDIFGRLTGNWFNTALRIWCHYHGKIRCQRCC